MNSAYELVVAGPAARMLAGELPESVAVAIIELLTGPLIVNPRRLGRELRDELAGTWSARRGSYRVLYRIDDDARTVTVVRIDHRRDVYRS